MFKRLLAAVGVGGPTVNTELMTIDVRPGQTVEGYIDLQGGEVQADIQGISLALRTHAEIEVGDSEGKTRVEFNEMPVVGAFQLAPGQQHRIPFTYQLSLQSPLTMAGGAPLRGAQLGLQTKVAIGGAIDAGDLDYLRVHPLPAQDRVLEAVHRLGFRFAGADMEYGRVARARQEFPAYQEIEYKPSPQLARNMSELEISFFADPEGVEVLLETDKRGGLFTESTDRFARFRIGHAEAEAGGDWAPTIASTLQSLVQRRHGIMGDLFG